MARKTRLEEEATLVADLEASMAASDLQALSRHVATCLRLGIANKHPDVMAKAKAKAAADEKSNIGQSPPPASTAVDKKAV